MIPYGQQEISQEDIDSVIEVLQSPFLTQGPKVPEFESKINDYIGSKYSTAFNSATSALHAACCALGLERGDVFWTSPISFVASANCGLYCGAKVDFVDIDPLTNNMCSLALKRKLEESEKNGLLPKIVIVVHLSGMPCDMEAIHALSVKFNFKIIEDASHAIGSDYNNFKTGRCTYSDITVFSFHPVKIITTAEGGMAMTNNEQTHEALSMLRTHGITRDESKMSKSPDGPWYYEQQVLGFNYRMTDLQAALGITQLSRINQFLAQRRDIERRYDAELANLPLSLPAKSHKATSALHLYVIKLKLEEIRCSHREVFLKLRTAGIGVNLHYIPIYRQPYFHKFNFNIDHYPNAEAYYNTAISIPMFPSMAENDQVKVIQALSLAVNS
jgi:UDP-4-amino-4,6-dideoxy-N-acetyl-beta-L-altrosamine transaminase